MAVFLCECLIGIIVFLVGACIFSFLNVVIYRVPKGLSFVTGRSMCPSCEHTLSFLDMVPVISYIVLRGKCRYCHTKIGSRDTWIEAFGGALALFCVYKFEYKVALLYFAFFAVLTVVAIMDIDTMEIADGCHVAILILAVISYFVVPEISIVNRLIGAVCVSLPMLVLALIIAGAFGGGDIKLMAACGLLLGWKLTLVSVVLAILFGGIYAVGLLAFKKKERKDQFAFGPFLCAGMMIAVFYGANLVDWYLGFMV